MESLAFAILAGGLASRLRPVTSKIPKALVPVCGRPFLAYQLELLRRRGIMEVVLCVGFLGEMIEEAFGDGREHGLRIRYSYDGEKLLGTGGALVKALPLLGPAFFVLYGDSYLQLDFADITRSFITSGRPGLMTVYANDGRWDTSNVILQGGLVKVYDKKHPGPEMRYIDYGAGILRARALDGAAGSVKAGIPVDLADIYSELACRSELVGYEVKERFYEIGSPSGLAEFENYVASKPA